MTGETQPAPPTPLPVGPVVTNNSGMHFTKTEAEYNMKSIRFILLTITAMFIVIAFLMVVLGISVYSHYHSFSSFFDGTVSRLLTPSAMSVFIGLALMVVSIFGFFGSLKLSTCMVNVYACILMTVFIIKLVVVILAFTMDSGKIMHYVNVPYWGYNDPEVQQEMDALQNTLSCCGSNTFMDYLDFQFVDQDRIAQANVQIDGDTLSLMVPKTCCEMRYNMEVCHRIYGIGCKEALVNVMIQNSTVIGVLGVSVMFINLLGIIFALLLARCIRKMKSAKALITWKLRENMIMQREAEERQKSETQVYIEQPESSQA